MGMIARFGIDADARTFRRSRIKAARTLALDDDLALQRRQLDGEPMASGKNIFCDQAEARSVRATTLALFRR